MYLMSNISGVENIFFFFFSFLNGVHLHVQVNNFTLLMLWQISGNTFLIISYFLGKFLRFPCDHKFLFYCLFHAMTLLKIINKNPLLLENPIIPMTPGYFISYQSKLRRSCAEFKKKNGITLFPSVVG